MVAIKCMKNVFDSVDHVNRLREIQALRRLSPHANIVRLLEVLYDRSTGRLALVFELMEMNAYEMVKGRKRYLSEDRILHVSYSLMQALAHMHKNGIFHRDVKPENLLVNQDATKLADFGSCRGIFSKQPFTEYISTRWYRAPECLLTDGYYNYKMDIWGVGCVLFELAALFPLFPGDNEIDQISRIHNVIGTDLAVISKLKKHGSHMDFDFPARAGSGIQKMLQHCPPDFVDLISKMLIYDAEERINAKQALRHPYFKEIRELDKKLRRAHQQGPTKGPGDGENAQQHQQGGAGGHNNLDDTKNSQQSDDEPRQQQAQGQVKLPSIGKAPPAQNESGGALPKLPNASKTVQQANQQVHQQHSGVHQQQSSGSSANLSHNSSGVHHSTGGGAGGQLPKLMPLGAKK